MVEQIVSRARVRSPGTSEMNEFFPALARKSIDRLAYPLRINNSAVRSSYRVAGIRLLVDGEGS